MCRTVLMALSWLPLGMSGFGQATLVVPTASHPTIQSAIVAASNGDTVLVQPGTYFERITFLGKAITVRGAQGPGLTRISGAAGFEETLVRFLQGEGPQSVLDSLQLELADVGSVLCVGTSPTIRNCWFQSGGSSPSSYVLGLRAGGITVRNGGNPRIENCQFVGCGRASYDAAGAVHCDMSSAILIGCMITNCVSGATGGVYSRGPSLTVQDCVFTNNTGGNWAYGAGGLCCNQVNQATITRCRFIGNVGGAQSFGAGGMTIYYTNATINACIFESNTGGVPSSASYGPAPANQGPGGGINIVGGPATTTVSNCVLWNNSGGAGGNGLFGAVYSGGSGGIHVVGNSTTYVVNCTLSGNLAGAGGGAPNPTPPGAGGIGIRGAASAIVNTLCWANTGGEVLVSGGGSAYVVHCDIQGGYPGFGNVSADPLFLAPASGNLHLGAGSPCIDAGTSAIPASIVQDVDGQPRAFYASVDIGADEFLSSAFLGSITAMGTIVPLLRVNGSSSAHAVIPLLQPFGLSVDAPPRSASADFVLAGVLGPPTLAAESSVLGVGTIGFSLTEPTFFILASSFSGSLAPWIAAGPAPFTLSLAGGIGVPLQCVLQALVETSPGILGPTNAIFVDVH